MRLQHHRHGPPGPWRGKELEEVRSEDASSAGKVAISRRSVPIASVHPDVLQKRPGVERPEQFQDCSTLELDQQASPAEDHTAGLYPHIVNSPPSVPHPTMWARPVSQPTTGRYPHMALAPSTVEMEIDEPDEKCF